MDAHTATRDAGLVQLIAPDGSRVADATYSPLAAGVGPEDLRTFYRQMVIVRRFDAEATSLQRQGELALWVPCLGQEAAQIGSGNAVAPQDFVFPAYREHGVALTRGLDLRKLLGLFRGFEHGGWDPSEHNFHLYTLVIGSHSLHATGYAMGVQRDGKVGTGEPGRDEAVIAYFGDGAMSQGDVSEAFTFSAVNNAPVVFFCQNNQWAISVPTARQTRVPLVHRGGGFGIPSVRVDGNDVLAVHAVTLEALERARSGGGPTFIEAFTYRMGAHTTSDDPTRYRAGAEVDYWKARDPIARLRTLLVNESLADEAFFEAVEAEAAEVAEAGRVYCRSLPTPPSQRMFEHIYSVPHPLVAEERAWFEEYEASFVAPGGAS